MRFKSFAFLIFVDAKMNDSFAAVLGTFPGILFQWTFFPLFILVCKTIRRLMLQLYLM